MKSLLIVAEQAEAHSLIQKSEIKDKYDILAMVSKRFEVSRLLTEKEVDIILIGASIERKEKEDILALALQNSTLVWIIPGFYEIMLSKAPSQPLGDSLVFEIHPIELEYLNRFLKRTLDIALSSIGLILLIPLLAFLALIVKLESPGNPIFSQKRVTLGGEEFTLYKFRTMVEKAEDATGPILATENDPRITRVGSLLRRTRLDELPQLFNVLCGSMSIVGPRPERPYFVDKFVQEIPHYSYRLKVKSGITGLAQVTGKYSTSPADKLKYDLLYMKRFSLLRDLYIILKTFKVVMMKDKAS